ncbi:beta-galactosidase [Amphibacillus marinus]|uniref:Beta-galactosidase n=1 Tax=Amphibacillus marinus TaxID=872970 RepID=A0A1H8LRA6_9BACI|nr:DUF4982 domain-containing protein [Amphibacillus marinus]SEO07692.1 beta-galactosidase [Amphibacillus marinus]
MNQTTLFNNDWTFVKTKLDVKDVPQTGFESVQLPHDWLIYNTDNLYEDGIGWYKKRFNYQDNDAHVLLYFEGVYMDSYLYVNGQLMGEWKNGYSSFEHDITAALVKGENELVVKVVHQSPNSRWYSGAGIYRNVWLKTRQANYLETDGIYVATKDENEHWLVELETESVTTELTQLSHKLFKGEQLVAEDCQDVNDRMTQQQLKVVNPALWSISSPSLYTLVTSLQDQQGNLIEQITQQIGFRKIAMIPNQGLFVNGVKEKINGVCEHHDLGALGAAFNPVALKRRLKLLKEMGVNGIRTAHNMPAKALMNLADEMGFFVCSEAFDMWERSKTPYDYARFFNDWVYRDVKSWVKRDRNHPSLIMWSIGNEIYDTHADKRGQEISQMLLNYVEEFDPKQNGRVTIGSNYMPWENAQKCADIVKVAGYNYAEKYYQQHHQEHPDWIIYGSETASVVQSRGIYHFPYHKAILADDDEQCSALGNSTTSWGAKSPEACIIAERDTPFSLGQFLWTGFDYIGEPTPYHTKNSYFGQLDTATFPKDTYYIYQAGWTNYKTAPMVHIFPYWDFNPGQTIDVRVASNAPKVELFLNDKSLGIKEINHAHGKEIVPIWQVTYQSGELKAIAYDENNQVIATDAKHSFGEVEQLALTADKTVIEANGEDLIFVEIAGIDHNGYPVENSTNRVAVKVSGAGRLVGLDNGDSTDYDQYKGLSRRLFSGKLMAIIAATNVTGSICIEVTANGLPAVALTAEAVGSVANDVQGMVLTENQETAIKTGKANEVPVRKIELSSKAGQQFTAEQTEIEIAATIYPKHTSYPELVWSVVTDEGVETNIAQVLEKQGRTIVKAKGDGKFRVRCTTKNGTDKVKIISELDLEATGLGVAYKNPYTFIAGGLYDDHIGDVSSGNERGFATSRDSETQVGFVDIDFGKFGSDTITIPIFALSSAQYPIQIWEGKPRTEGSVLLADVIYQKESIWNVYQPDTYKLAKRLTGLTSIYFLLNEKVHIKGFTFEPYNRAFNQNDAVAADQIYGDTFTKTATAVEGIGNNVSLSFEALDFGEHGLHKLIIHGHSPIDKNTIHVRFEQDGQQINQLIEFTESEGYVEREFALETVKGMQNVTFIFLPGSQFDFSWFKFE